ncbi:PAS domain-containing protein [Dorea phocaeensis]|nr:PAS domain-containing protein [Dorea phocaeensis]
MGMKYLTAPETKYILNTMQDGVISVNKTGMVTYINEVAERLVV